MKTSEDRILTTHVGSLPRPDGLLAILEAQDRGRSYSPDALGSATATAVAEAVRAQIAAGIDIVCDGEMSKLSYTVYVKHRLSGIADGGGRTGPARGPADLEDHPGFLAWRVRLRDLPRTRYAPPRCVGPVAYGDRAPLSADIANLRRAADAQAPVEAFLNAASPGVLPLFVEDAHYGDEDGFVADLAEALRSEYEAVHAAGFLLQIDCPEIAMGRHIDYQDLSDAAFLRVAERNIEALNHATANIPPEAMRMHVCWGNYPGPHTRDIAVAKIFDVIFKGRPQAILFEGANPRHDHEWRDWETAAIPDDKILVPGVIDSTTNFVEHPRLVAERIRRYAGIVGRERVIAGTDCGFATVAGMIRVYPSVVWAKLGALAEGARIASEALWGRPGPAGGPTESGRNR